MPRMAGPSLANLIFEVSVPYRAGMGTSTSLALMRPSSMSIAFSTEYPWAKEASETILRALVEIATYPFWESCSCE